MSTTDDDDLLSEQEGVGYGEDEGERDGALASELGDGDPADGDLDDELGDDSGE